MTVLVFRVNDPSPLLDQMIILSNYLQFELNIFIICVLYLSLPTISIQCVILIFKLPSKIHLIIIVNHIFQFFKLKTINYF